VNSTTEPTPASHTDEELLFRYAQSGDRRWFSELVRRYERELYNYLRRYLGQAEMAEDVFQATFLQLHLKCKQYEEGRKVRPWLYAIATHQAIDAQRRNKRHKAASLDRLHSKSGGEEEDLGKLLDLLVSDDIDPAERVSSQENAEWIRGALEELPEPMRVALDLVFYQGLKYREAADVLSVPVGTVKSRVHSAVLKLSESWNQTHQKPR
jgi:RNA polymerase sigma-70 factor (ECF subfamily)